MSEKLPRVTSEQLIKALHRAGFEERRQRGSHLHLCRSSDSKRVTVPIHKGRIIHIGTLRAILRDIDLKIEDFRELLNK
jgi:predicted RNA binding protein YcfA (HicA-like mRNA interferase family)